MDRFQEYWRKKLFYTLDKLHKHSIKKYISELKDHETAAFSNGNLENKLEQILSIATTQTAFYKEIKTENLDTFPVITKAFLVQNRHKFTNSQYSPKQLIQVKTSGSYGLPFTFMLTKEKKRRQKAEVLFYGQKAGYEVGVKHAYVRSNPPKSALKFWLQHEVFYAAKIMDTTFLENARRSLLQDNIRVIIGFPTAITRIAQYCIEKGDLSTDFKIEGVICCSENLTAVQRTLMVQAFNCKVHNRYSTEELGVLGYQYKEDSGFEINTCNYIVEVVDLHKDTPVNLGSIGRVVVTDLHSDAFPLIRYETGDLAVVKKYIKGSNNWVQCLETLSGRTMQIVQSTSGVSLYPLYLDTIMEEFPEYMQYQLIQKTTTDFIVNLVPTIKGEHTGKTNRILEEKLKAWLGNNANIKIKFVSDLKQLPSGKRPYIINELAHV